MAGVQTDLLIAGLLGLLVATTGILAYRLSDRSHRAQAPRPHDSDDDVAAILGALPSTSILVGPEGQLLRVSPEAYTFGLVREGTITVAQVADLVARSRAKGASASEQVRWTRADGTDVVFDVHAAPLSGSRTIVLGHDLTAQLRLDETRRDFVANVSHELKTPVGAIALLAETVEAAADDPGAVRRFSRRMEVEATRLAALIQDIIDLSRLQAPETKPATVPVPIAKILTEARDALAVETERRQARIVIEPTGFTVL